ncbi:hypothetical protein Scel_50560 [Streptomyces cellostaticus]|nr:hypothetical protein Scel_50560 [Streptomyces cellostaticus]
MVSVWGQGIFFFTGGTHSRGLDPGPRDEPLAAEATRAGRAASGSERLQTFQDREGSSNHAR